MIDLHTIIGIGVAGNFTGHLEQAGEAKDFVHIVTEEADAPKGIFPFYVPSHPSFLGTFPLSSSIIALPEGKQIQPEPEVALLCTLRYENDQIAAVMPDAFAAYNDCSIRADAPKISNKKNWGKNSKGLSSQLIEINTFAPGGVMDSYNLVCFLKRNGMYYEYGENSELKTYSYFYNKLLGWIVEKMNFQENQGPLENIHELLQQAQYPQHAIISIGATRYTQFGEQTYLQEGDEVFVIAYDRSVYNIQTLPQLLDNWQSLTEDISILHQVVNVLK